MLSAPQHEATAMTDANDATPAALDTPPDRLSNDPRSKFHDAALLERGIGIRFKGSERTNVEEYCISEGWIRVAVGRALDRRGNPMTLKLAGPVEAWFLDTAADADDDTDETPAD